MWAQLQIGFTNMARVWHLDHLAPDVEDVDVILHEYRAAAFCFFAARAATLFEHSMRRIDPRIPAAADGEELPSPRLWDVLRSAWIEVLVAWGGSVPPAHEPTIHVAARALNAIRAFVHELSEDGGHESDVDIEVGFPVFRELFARDSCTNPTVCCAQEEVHLDV